MRVVALVQARMGSKRLPGKVLREVAGKPLLGYVIDALEQVPSLSNIVVATTKGPGDDPIVDYCFERGVATYRGADEDVLERFYEAAKAHMAEVVVRITADCPLIDHQIVEQVLQHYHDEYLAYDYVSNTQHRSFPRGLDVEVFSFEALERAHQNATDPAEREHVTLHIYRNPDNFRIGSFEYRLTVDTEEDLELVTHVLEEIKGERITWQNVLRVLEQHPKWVHINAKVEHECP